MARLFWDHHHALDPQRFRPAEAALAEAAPPALFETGRLALVATVGADVVGYLQAASREAQDAGFLRGRRTTLIQELFVSPGHRGRGCARRLIGAAIDWGRRGGSEAIQIAVLTGNGEALRLYRALGFGDRLLQLELPLVPSG